jgi:hypothetical protein
MLRKLLVFCLILVGDVGVRVGEAIMVRAAGPNAGVVNVYGVVIYIGVEIV